MSLISWTRRPSKYEESQEREMALARARREEREATIRDVVALLRAEAKVRKIEHAEGIASINPYRRMQADGAYEAAKALEELAKKLET